MLPARSHHKDDNVTHYFAPGTRATWEAADEQRLVAAEAEIGKIDTSWNGGVVIDFLARDRERNERAKRAG